MGLSPTPLLVLLLALSRPYHGVPLAKVKDTYWTHIAVCGRVETVRRQADGDAHLRIGDGTTFIVGEVVSYHPLPLPKVGQMVRVAGVSRYDKRHRWYEVHPIEAITVVSACGKP